MAITKKDIASPKDIIAYFVSKLNNWINVAGVDDLGNNQWKILTCNTKWAQKGFTIPDVGKIIDVDFNNYITVESETEILVENFELYPVKFIHGTAIQVNIENFTGENSLDPKLRLPVIYLREFTEMTRQSKWSNNLIRIEIPLTLYFLTKGNHDEWKTSDAYNEAIYPMKNLVDEFQKVLYKEKGNVGEWKEDTLNFHPKFGVRYVKKQNSDSKGVEVNYFDDNLTGVECAINLPLKIDFCNRCKDFVPPVPIESVSLFINENLFKVYTTSPANLAIRNSLNQYVGTLDPDNGLVLVADSVITNDPTSPTYTQAVKATENLVLPAQNILVNTVNEGLINSVGDIEINTNVTPDSVSVVGRVVSINVPTGETPSGVLFDFPTPQQRVSYRTGDVGWRVQNGWYDYTPPATPAAVAELDYSSANFWYLLKNNLVVDGQSSKTRFVDVDGVQTFSATGNKDLILVDKFTGLGIYRGNLASTYSWNTAIDAANTLSIVVDGVTYDEWYLISVAEWVKLVYGRGNNGAMVDAVTSVNILNMAAATYILSDTWSSVTFYKRTWRDDAVNNILGNTFANLAGFRALFITKQTMSLITAP